MGHNRAGGQGWCWAVVVAGCVLWLSGSASAHEGHAPAGEGEACDCARSLTRTGFYAGFTGSYQKEFYSDLGLATGDTDSSSGLSVRFGRRMQKFVSVEAEVEFLNDFVEDSLVSGNAWVIGANLRGHLPLGRWVPTASFGLNWMTGNVPIDPVTLELERADALAIRVGGGVEVYITDSFSLLLETTWVQPFGALEDFPFLSIGGGFFHHF